ncbi:hypothetical protein D3C80_1553880 [compost metagenome]
MAAKRGANDEKAHETELATVGGNGAATDQLAVQLRPEKGLGVGRPEQLGIVKARVPALIGSPADQLVQFGAGHVADDQRSRHRETSSIARFRKTSG